MAFTTHAAIRAVERLGVDEVVDQILSGKAKRVLVRAVSLNDLPMYDVEVDGVRVRVAFDPLDQVVVTVLPLEFPAERYRRIVKQGSKRKREFFRGFEEEE